MNPFEERPLNINSMFEKLKTLYPKSYNPDSVDPYTKTRIILLNGAEFEANWFSHNFARHVCDNDLRRELALTRFIEKQQQTKIALLKPACESILEHTISYEQLAVDLTAFLAKTEKDCYVKKALDFALLEDFDHLYRYANLLKAETGKDAKELVGCYTEIMPARPTIAHHRYPSDNVKRATSSKTCDTRTTLNTMIITAAEQQTMNYYMNVVNLYKGEAGRRLYQEIALVEEEHVTQYESLMDTQLTWLENLLWHEFNECYLYYSCYMTETDPYIKLLWEEYFNYEVGHLHKAAELLKKYEGKDPQQVILDPNFPEPVQLKENIEYVREILGTTVQFTSVKEEYENINDLPDSANIFSYQKFMVEPVFTVPSHVIIEHYIDKNGYDYRYEIAQNPVPALRNRKDDNTSVGRIRFAAESSNFNCN